ncbi:MAG: TlpA family protein disulfide reductase [Proteobacteria bacterium]|nr:TlpA family protein disulfide reductase [Pseudomonadota bacterium]
MRFFLVTLILLLFIRPLVADETKYLNLPFRTLEGKKVTLAELKGKPVLLEFWASWCFACTMSFAHTNKIAEKYKKQIYTIGINTDVEDPLELKDIIEENNIKFPVWINHQEGNFHFGGISSLPTFIILDKNGKLVKKIVGLKKDTESEIENQLKKLLQ